MEWIFSICCRQTRKKYAVALLGCQEDQKHILGHLIPNYKCDRSLRPFSEEALATNGMELLLQCLDDNRDLNEIRGIHINHAVAIIFAVDAGNKASVNKCVSLITEETTKTKDLVLVFCRSNIYNSEAVSEIKKVCEENGHGKIEFILYEDAKASSNIHKGIDWVCNRLED